VPARRTLADEGSTVSLRSVASIGYIGFTPLALVTFITGAGMARE